MISDTEGQSLGLKMLRTIFRGEKQNKKKKRLWRIERVSEASREEEMNMTKLLTTVSKIFKKPGKKTKKT